MLDPNYTELEQEFLGVMGGHYEEMPIQGLRGVFYKAAWITSGGKIYVKDVSDKIYLIEDIADDE